jgi:AraC-like DNA-binding protein
MIAREGYATDLSVAELARLSGLSVRNMSRLFLCELGVTPKQLLMSLRIDKAKELLLAGVTVTEAAYGVGYKSLSQFIQAFRQTTGQIPSEYQGQSTFGRKPH